MEEKFKIRVEDDREENRIGKNRQSKPSETSPIEDNSVQRHRRGLGKV